MAALTDYAEAKILNHLLGVAAFTQPTTIYCGLFSTAPTDSTSGTELSGFGYSRQAITFASTTGGISTSNNNVSFTASGGNWANIVAIGIFDAQTNGNLLLYKTTNSITINNTDTLNFASGNITVTLD